MKYLLYTGLLLYALMSRLVAAVEVPFFGFPPFNPALNNFGALRVPSETIIEKQEVRALPTQIELVIGGEPLLGKPSTQSHPSLQNNLVDGGYTNSTISTTITPSITVSINSGGSRDHHLFETKQVLANTVPPNTREPDSENDISIPVSIGSSVVRGKQQHITRPETNSPPTQSFYTINQHNSNTDVAYSTTTPSTTTFITVRRVTTPTRADTNNGTTINSSRYITHPIFATIKKIPIPTKIRSHSQLAPIQHSTTLRSPFYTSGNNSTIVNHGAHSTTTILPNITFKWNNLTKSTPTKNQNLTVDKYNSYSSPHHYQQQQLLHHDRHQKKLAYTLHHDTQKSNRA